MKYLIWPITTCLIVLFTAAFTWPNMLKFSFAYLWLGVLVFIIPTITFLSFFPKLISKYIKTASYFFLLAFMFEFTGLSLNQWSFPGTHFIGWINLFGFRLPIEEFFFWFVMSSISILSYYEFFDDDRK